MLSVVDSTVCVKDVGKQVWFLITNVVLFFLPLSPFTFGISLKVVGLNIYHKQIGDISILKSP